MTYFDPNLMYVIKSNYDENNVLSYSNQNEERPSVIVEPANQHVAQQWWFRDGYLINAHNNLCLTIDHDQVSLLLVAPAGATDQRWQYNQESCIVSMANGMVLDIDGKTGPSVMLHNSSAHPWQQFTIYPASGQQQQQQQPMYQPPMNTMAGSPPPFPSTQNQSVYQSPQTPQVYVKESMNEENHSDEEKEKDVEFKQPHEGFSLFRFIKQCIETFKFFFSPVLAIIFTIMALVTFIAIIGLFSQFQTILNDFNKKPVVDFTLTASTSCPTGFQNVENLGVWGGIKSACDCLSISDDAAKKYRVDKEFTYTDNLCPETNQTKAGCTGVTGVDPVKLNLWYFTNGANQKFCEKRGGYSLFEQVQLKSSLECPTGYKVCAGTSNSITEHTRCAKECGLSEFELKDGTTGAELKTNSSANNWPIVGFRMSEGNACWDINKDGSSDSSNVKSYRDSGAVGNGGSGCTGDEINPYFEKKVDAKLSDLLLINGLNIDTHARSSVIKESVKTTTTWSFYAERQRPWRCSPQVVQSEKKGSVIAPSEFQKNADAINIIFAIQVTLFVISLLTTLLISIAIPALLIYNGILRKIWCGYATLKEKDRDDIERYQLIALIFMFVVKSIKIIPLAVCIVVAYAYQSFYSKLKASKCSDDIFQGVIDSYTDKMRDSTGWLNFIMLGVAVLSCFGSVLACGICFFKIIRNKIKGRDAFDRGIRFENDGKHDA